MNEKRSLYRIAPGLGVLAAYQRDWLRHDLIAGVSVAAVALPTAIAYAQIIGLDPVIGLYAAIPALLAYALFGTSRHLIVNPDAATCAMIAATLTPLAAGNSEVSALAIRRLGHLHRSVLLFGELAPARFSGRLPFPADSDWLSQWRGNQYLPGPDRQGIRLSHDSRTASLPT